MYQIIFLNDLFEDRRPSLATPKSQCLKNIKAVSFSENAFITRVTLYRFQSGVGFITMMTNTENASTNKTPEPDRQKFRRVQHNDQVAIFPILEANGFLEVPEKSLQAKSLDVSEGGIRLELKKNQRPTEILKVCFHLSSEKPLTVYAKLIWKKENIFGYEYLVLDDADRAQVRAYVNGTSISSEAQNLKKHFPFYWGNLSE